MITILYFARFREKLGQERETLEWAEPAAVRDLLAVLVRRGGTWQDVLGSERGVLVAINQQMATLESIVRTGDEVAIFPPVTGG